MPKVMIIHSDSTNAALLKTLTELDGFEVVVVSQGAMVLEKANQELPDYFVLSAHLPDKDVKTVIAVLRAEPKFAKTPIALFGDRPG